MLLRVVLFAVGVVGCLASEPPNREPVETFLSTTVSAQLSEDSEARFGVDVSTNVLEFAPTARATTQERRQFGIAWLDPDESFPSEFGVATEDGTFAVLANTTIELSLDDYGKDLVVRAMEDAVALQVEISGSALVRTDTGEGSPEILIEQR